MQSIRLADVVTHANRGEATKLGACRTLVNARMNQLGDASFGLLPGPLFFNALAINPMPPVSNTSIMSVLNKLVDRK